MQLQTSKLKQKHKKRENEMQKNPTFDHHVFMYTNEESNFYATFGKYGDGRSVQRKINTYFGCENKVKEWQLQRTEKKVTDGNMKFSGDLSASINFNFIKVNIFSKVKKAK